MTNGELMDLLMQFPLDMELYHPRYTVDQKPGSDKLVVDPGRLRLAPLPPEHLSDGTTRITLSQGKFSIIDTADWPLIKDYRWHARMSSTGRWYATTNMRSGYKANGRPHFTGHDIHQIIIPGVALVDHRDGDGLNNRRGNLRPANRSLNAYNQIPKGETYGLHQYRKSGRWTAHLRTEGNRNGYLGSFGTMEEARAARNAAEALLPDGYTREAIRKSE